MKIFKAISTLALFLTFLNANILQETIDNAKVGSILKLKAGTYKGNIVINKPLTIIGIEDGVIIDGGGKGTVISITSSFVNIKNLRVTGSGNHHHTLDAGIVIKDAKKNEISDVVIDDCLFGIDMQNVSDSIIKNNTIYSKELPLGLRGDGIRLWYSNDNLIQANSLIKSRDMVIWYSHGNVIEKNYGEYCRYSLHFMYAGKNYVRDNEYRFNSVGIFFMYSKDTIATGNIVKSSLGTTGIGIGLKDVSNFVLKNNTVIYNAKGIYIDRSPFEPGEKNWIEDNNILYNSEGLYFHSLSEDNIIKRNNMQGNIEDVINDSRGSRTYKNIFTENYWDNYEGFDRDQDGYGDTPHRIYQYADKLWLYNPNVKFFYGSPVISMLNFLAKLAPFSEPIFLLEDARPKMVLSKNREMK